MDGRWFLLWLAVVAALIGGIHGWPELSAWLKLRQELAGWVQAVGSILAIGATGWAVQHAHRLQERQRLRTEHLQYTQFLEAVFQLVGGAFQIARKIHEHIERVEGPHMALEDARTMSSELGAVTAALARVDVARLDRFEFVQAVLVANAVAPRLLQELEAAISQAYTSKTTNSARVDERAQETAHILKPFGKILLDAITKRGGFARSDTFPV